MNDKLYAYVYFIVLLSIVSCAEVEKDREAQIRQYIEHGKALAEQKDYTGLGELVHADYKDHKDLDKKRLINMFRAYFFMHNNIHLLTRIDSMAFQSENQVFVTLYVAMAGKVIDSKDALRGLRAQIYKIELQLSLEDQWLLEQAKWQRAMLRDMM